MENKDGSMLFPQKAADHITRILQKMAKFFQTVMESLKNNIDNRTKEKTVE